MKINLKLKNELKKIAIRHDLVLFVLFGSRAKGNFRKDSDFDFAYLSFKKIDSSTNFKIKKEISNIINNTSIDLINLNLQDDPLLRNEILKNGICIYEKKKDLFNEIQTNALFNYLYYKPYLDLETKQINKSLKELAIQK